MLFSGFSSCSFYQSVDHNSTYCIYMFDAHFKLQTFIVI